MSWSLLADRWAWFSETSGRMLRVVQTVRNCIHPSSVVKRNARANERLANISLETVKEVLRSIRDRAITVSTL